jgi:hypothetical protein
MKPLTVIYWTRACLGVVIGLLCAAYVYVSVSGDLANLFTLMTGLSFAMLFYIVTFYVIKLRFLGRVEKQSKLMTQGIGIYFFAWLVSWILVITLLLPSVSVSIYVDGNLAEGQTFWVAARNAAGNVVQNVTTASGSIRVALLSPGTYTFEIGNGTELDVTDQNQTRTLAWLQSYEITFSINQSLV